MPIIKHSDIIQQGDPLKVLNDSLELITKNIDKLTKSSAKLDAELKAVQQTSDGKEAKKLVETTSKLNEETEKLTKSKKAAVTINDQIIKAQKALTDAESLEAVELEKLKQQKQAQNKLNKDIAKELNAIEKGYQKETKSINSLRESTKKLTKERNALNLETEEGIQRLKEINDQLDENNEAIKENVDGYTQQKINIGNYGSALEGVAPGMAGAVQGFKQMTLAALKFIATPIGAVIAAIVAVFKLLQGAFNRSLSSQEKLNKITGKLSAAFGVLLDILIPVVEFILDQVLSVFEAMGDAVVFVIDKLEKWGIISEETADKVSSALDKSTEAADRLAQAERNLAVADIALQKLQLKFQTLAERQRQIRDDESRSIEDRIAANKELGRILQEQTQAELVQAAKILQVAKDRQTVNGESIESIREIGEAEIKLLEITERVEAQKSEQLVNTNTLLREQAALELAAFNKKLERFNKEQEILDKELEDYDEEVQRQLEKDDLDQASADKFEANHRVMTNSSDEYRKKIEENAQLIRDSSISAGQQIGHLLGQGLLSFKEFGKILLKTTLDLVQKQANIWLAGVLAREIFTKGLAGIATAAAITVLVNAAFQAAKTGIANFNEGTEFVPGTGNKDTVPAMLTPGERVVPAEINKQLMGIPNSDLPKLGQNSNMMLAGLLMNGNKINEQMLTALLNGVSSYNRDGYTYLRMANGKIEKFLIDG